MPWVGSSNYDVSADDQRFLMVREDGPASASRIVVVLNWDEEVKAKERARLEAEAAPARPR